MTSRASRTGSAQRPLRSTRRCAPPCPPTTGTVPSCAAGRTCSKTGSARAAKVAPELAEFADHVAGVLRGVRRAGESGSRAAGARGPASRSDDARDVRVEDPRLRGGAGQAGQRASSPRQPRCATSPGCCGPSTTPPSYALGDTPPDPQSVYRAAEWVARNRDAFCAGYTQAAGADPRDQNVLLRAYEADKVVYEVVYESRNRPALGVDPDVRPRATGRLRWQGVPPTPEPTLQHLPRPPSTTAPGSSPIVSGADHNPHGLLGPHPTKDGVVVRALRPLASSVTVVTADGRFPMRTCP